MKQINKIDVDTINDLEINNIIHIPKVSHSWTKFKGFSDLENRNSFLSFNVMY